MVRGLFVPLLSDPGPDTMEDGKNDDSTPVLNLSNVTRFREQIPKGLPDTRRKASEGSVGLP